jgi:glycerol kinase
MGDQQASLFGHGCLETGTAKATYGTGCFFLVNQGEKLPEGTGHSLIDTLCRGTGGRTAYALEGSIFAAGSVLTWLVEQLGLAETPASTDTIARQVASTNGVYFVPALTGLGPPYWDSDARAGFLGITTGTTKAHVVRAALESIAYRVRDLVEIAEGHLGRTLSMLQADGGVSQNNFLMQFQADILGIPVVRSHNTDTTALGAALLAGQSVGLWDETQVNRLIRPGRRYEPTMSPQERDRLYQGWKESVCRVLKHG